jgi:hypothetical protein
VIVVTLAAARPIVNVAVPDACAVRPDASIVVAVIIPVVANAFVPEMLRVVEPEDVPVKVIVVTV